MKYYLKNLFLIGLIGMVLAGSFLASSAQAAKKPLQLVYPNKVCYEPFIIAEAKGFFAAEGLEVDVKLVGGGILAAESLMTGAADVAAMGDAPFLIAASRSERVRLLTGYAGGSKMHRLISRRGLIDVKQLEGARVGIQMGSSTYGALLAWSKYAGLDVKKIEFVPLSPLDMPQAMQTGQIDAMAGSEPWPSNVEALCADSVHELTDFSALNNSFPLVVASSKQTLSERKEDLDSLIRGLQRAVAFMHENPDETVRIVAAVTGLPEEQQRKCTYRLNWQIGFDENDSSSMAMTASYLKSLGKIEMIPEFSAAFRKR
ncbi:ABC transporter substrate-binding protein [uncultured Desulfuromusa sp.]|uniref:ABC transporter substrate-binding protein n=1 Tax=uncultured Desulfuromusa sp. TaxID=219183 RepID=UPI002AA6A9A0|nr:ABC transporter substrate-binding protein [uncultured Desulfuromusa sp.]